MVILFSNFIEISSPVDVSLMHSVLYTLENNVYSTFFQCLYLSSVWLEIEILIYLWDGQFFLRHKVKHLIHFLNLCIFKAGVPP